MDRQRSKEQFLREVFPAELEEVGRRRERVDQPDVPSASDPSTRLGLVGLALSGGGIRSATLSLGVIQALAKHGLLKTVDFLSTVSGGGFTGSCLSSILNSADTAPEQGRFPLQFQVGSEESLALGHLRDSSRYLAPGGVLDKLRIPALVLRGIFSNMLIFLMLIFVLVLATETVYEVGQRVDMPFGRILLSGIAGFIVLVVAFPLVSRLVQGRASWAQRNLGDMVFTVALVALLIGLFFVPVFILVDQAIDRSWGDVQESIAGNLLHPFEARDLTQWVVILGVLVVFMLAGRASEKVSRVGGRIVLFAVGLIGPTLLVLIYLALVVVEIDSPFINPDKLFSLDLRHADELDDQTVSADLRTRFRANQIRLSNSAEVIVLREDVRWLIRDGRLAYVLEREQNDLSVYPDFADALSRGTIPPELIESMDEKGHVVNSFAVAPPELRDNRFEISGSHVYRVHYDAGRDEWSLEQVVDVVAAVDALRSDSQEVRSGTLIQEDAALSDDDTEQAIRFVEEGNAHDVILILDNSRPPFDDIERFQRTFHQALEETLASIRASVRMAVFVFDHDVDGVTGLELLTDEQKRVVVEGLFGGDGADSALLDFQGRESNLPAALVRAIRELTEKGRTGAKQSIVLVSDGIIELGAGANDDELTDWVTEELAADAQADGIRIYGIALSTGASFELFHALTSQTGGSFYPVFESADGVTLEDLRGATGKLEDSAGSKLRTPLRAVTVTDQNEGVRYELSRANERIRIRATLPDAALSAQDVEALTAGVREVFEQQGVELSARATSSPAGDGRWEVRDPYRYVLTRVGRKLKVDSDEASTEGQGWIGRLIPSSLWDDTTDWVFVGVLAILLIYWLTVDVNATAAHRFYRDRLSKAYLMRVAESGEIEHNDKQKLSELNTAGSAAPYHLINVALNLQGSKEPSLRGRNSGFFIFSKRFTGSIETGFQQTAKVEALDVDVNLGTALAISGAAAAPNMGATTLKPLVFIMTLLNVRLGYWLPNPVAMMRSSWLTRLALRRGPGPKYLLNESLGRVDARGTFVNVSDGGHIENLGVYELLRRRCKFIIAVDGGADPEMRFGSLVQLLLYARIDMGIEVDIDLDPIRTDENGLSSNYWALGKIRYAGGEVGHLLYIKSAITGNEYEYVREYRSRHPDFPHEPTADQFFNESRFEAYRALGYHIGEQLFGDDAALGEFKSLKSRARAGTQSSV